MDRLRALARSRRWLPLAALALVSLALGSAVFSGATFTSQSANSASLAAASFQLGFSKPNQTIVAATGISPGESRQGTIEIGNVGNAPGTVVLEASGLTGTALAAVLDLEVDDITGGAAVEKWSGKLGSFGSVALGTFAAGSERDYRLTLSWPAASNDASLQGASSSLTFHWRGSAKGSG
jgi:hypothetical protein